MRCYRKWYSTYDGQIIVQTLFPKALGHTLFEELCLNFNLILTLFLKFHYIMRPLPHLVGTQPSLPTRLFTYKPFYPSQILFY